MLKKIYDFLFYSCKHEYITVETLIKNRKTYYSESQNKIYILQCKKCGNIKTKTI